MVRWRRWVFELRQPLDVFQAAWERALATRGVTVTPGEHFDWVIQAFGARAFVRLEWADEGLAAVVKIKAGVFAAPVALEHLLLDAGREAQARLAFDKDESSPPPARPEP